MLSVRAGVASEDMDVDAHDDDEAEEDDDEEEEEEEEKEDGGEANGDETSDGEMAS